MGIRIHCFIKHKNLVFLKSKDQIKNNPNLGIKIFKKTGQYNAFARNQENFLGLFYIAIFDLSRDYFTYHDLYTKRQLLTSKNEFGVTFIFLSNLRTN